MDSLIRQMRGRFSNVGGHREEPSSSERRIPIQKTQSFKGEKKKTQNWLERQFSWQMSPDYESSAQMDQAAAVAAAAYAIKSLQEPEIKDEKKATGDPQPLLSKLWSKKEDAAISMPEQKQSSEGPEPSLTRLKSEKEDAQISSLERAKTSEGPEPSFTSRKEDTSISVTEPGGASISDSTKPKRTPSKVTDPSRSMKKTPTFAEELSGSRPEGAMEETDLPPTKHETATSRPDIPPTFKPATPPPDIPPTFKPATPPSETRKQTSARPRTDETEADAWERAEMAKIQERYEKLNETILTWEDKKKKKARTKLDRTERGLERRRLKALQKFRNEMNSIDQIAGGARAQAVERRKNEELKAKEKANTIRITGKVPATCFCF